MKKIFTLFLVFMTSIPIALSYDFEIDGIYYNKLGGDSVAVTYGGRSHYNSCYYSESITIPEKVNSYRVTTIGEYAFYDCDDLSSITIPTSVTSIGNDAFTSTPFCRNLPSSEGFLYINNVLYEIDGFDYKNDTLEIREGTVSISDYALKYNRYIKCVIIPNSVVKVGHRMFSGISSIIVKLY